MINKLGNYVLFFIIVFFLYLPAHSFSASAARELILEDFEILPGKLFSLWLKRGYSDQQAGIIYSIRQENGNSFLHSDTTGNPTLSIQIGKIVNETGIYPDHIKQKWDIKKYPFLRWDWRANKLPRKGDESKAELNDSAAGIYVAIQKIKIPFFSWKYQPLNILKYVWSTTLPEGKIVHRNYKFLGVELYHVAYWVLQSGEKQSRKWVTEKRNIAQDYQKAFGEEPKYSPILIGILSDSNDTLSEASADFENFYIMSD